MGWILFLLCLLLCVNQGLSLNNCFKNGLNREKSVIVLYGTAGLHHLIETKDYNPANCFVSPDSDDCHPFGDLVTTMERVIYIYAGNEGKDADEWLGRGPISKGAKWECNFAKKDKVVGSTGIKTRDQACQFIKDYMHCYYAFRGQRNFGFGDDFAITEGGAIARVPGKTRNTNSNCVLIAASELGPWFMKNNGWQYDATACELVRDMIFKSKYDFNTCKNGGATKPIKGACSTFANCFVTLLDGYKEKGEC